MTKSNCTHDSRFWAALLGWLPLSAMGCAEVAALPDDGPGDVVQAEQIDPSSLFAQWAALGSSRGEANDLRSWSQHGAPRSGNWEIDAGGTSVEQTVNGAPSYFLSAQDFIDVSISGTFEVSDGSDDDFIGFVFGYRDQAGSQTEGDFLLFDWRGGDQSTASEGFTLTRIKGAVSNSASTNTPWWGHTHESMEVLASDYGPGKGWQPNREHEYSLTYLQDRVLIKVDGVEIFDLTGEFEGGRFGFYNLSQAKVRYSALTLESVAPGFLAQGSNAPAAR